MTKQTPITTDEKKAASSNEQRPVSRQPPEVDQRMRVYEDFY